MFVQDGGQSEKLQREELKKCQEEAKTVKEQLKSLQSDLEVLSCSSVDILQCIYLYLSTSGLVRTKCGPLNYCTAFFKSQRPLKVHN